MIDLNDIAIFAKVAQLESFSRAARALGMPVSTVSRRVTVLEEQLGATLLQRTTRRLNLTPQGRAYFTQCSEPLGELYDAERALTQVQRKPEGLLRVSVPVTIGQESFYEFISSFLRTYPRIQIDLFVTNVFLDLIAENVDVALRYGELRDSTLVAQRIGKSVRYLVCTPDYLGGRNPPSKPHDLREHQCVRKRRTHPPAPRMVLSRNFHSHDLPHAPVSAVQASGVSRGIEGLEEPALDSAAVMARRGGPACTPGSRSAMQHPYALHC